MTATTERNDSPRRPPFTAAQQVQAAYIGRVTETHRKQRPVVLTHAIDNVTPDIIADRDDGIYVEVEEAAGKGYRVHVTVADVAAHVRCGSPLSEGAWQRAFTVYKPGAIDSMFPKILEENLSLEHWQERLGLTVNITLDRRFTPIHTSFTPVITTPDNASYAQVHERMGSEPQFALMARIADNIRHSYSTEQDAAWDELVEDRLMRRGRSESDIAAMQMVATYMLLANHCVAEFFSNSGLPFLYRNFDGSQTDAYATYSTKALRHSAIESMGMNGAYCHFTSPIRRAPDYFNGVMVHYAINSLAHIEQKMQKAYPELLPRKLHEQVWLHGPEILRLTSAEPLNTRNRATLRDVLYDAAQASSTDTTTAEQPLTSLMHGLIVLAPPLSYEQLDMYTQHINALARSPQIARIHRMNEKFDESRDVMIEVSGYSRAALSAMSADKFGSVLQAAATTGEILQHLFDETMDRLSHGTLDRVTDLYTIFMQAQYPASERWRALKREVARILKNDPGTVNAMLYRHDHDFPDSVQELHSHVSGSDEARDTLPAPMHKALLVMGMEDGSQVAAPFYSVGHNGRAALSHAKFSFLEHYAFTELQPVAQTAVPNLLYADLDLPTPKKRELFERMVRGNSAESTIHTEQTAIGHRTIITVSGGDVTVPITTEAEASTPDISFQSALRRMLRHDAFKIAMSRNEGNQYLLNPQTVLEEEVESRGGSVMFTIAPVDGRSSSGYQAIATVQLNGAETAYAEIAPNMDRALRVVSAKVLASLGTIHAEILPGAASWSLLRSPSDTATPVS